MSGSAAPGFANLNTLSTDFAATKFVVDQALGKVATSTIVKVVKVTNAGGVSPVGFVDVIPQVAQVDGAGNTTPHGTIHHLPYLRVQGGTDAVILDPKIGDLGIAVFANRDLSAVKNTKKASPPGSRRRFDYSDGMYLGGLLNGTPVQYVRFHADGLELVSPTEVKITAPSIVLTGNVTSTGTFQNNTKNISSTHIHGGVQSGGSTTSVPV